ncbi:MAG: nucleotidyltransferase substrate binding protein [Pseudomonadota bacterium]|nr:nucleotidyltransferase substrate binding protein [Gammaproteobacteria bacterium]MDQ3584078.1 nucleotidyltransferase substrate binding protein [Pseudomonadota bacterium]
MKLDLSSLKKAINSLERAVRRSLATPEDTELRDAVIQRFEYTYELSWKMLKRRLELDAPTPAEIDALGFKDLIRQGAERGLIAQPQAWFEYRRQRNITSHTYDEDKATQVHQAAVAFLEDAESLLQELERRNVSE